MYRPMKDITAELDYIRDFVTEYGGMAIGDRSVSDQYEANMRAEMKRATDFVEELRTLIPDAFESGFKAAGGTMIPDDARNMVELSLDRGQISVLAKAAETVIGNGLLNYGEDEALNRFLENINIYRNKSAQD